MWELCCCRWCLLRVAMRLETYARTAALFLTVALLLGLYVRFNPTPSTGKWVFVPQCEEPRQIRSNDRVLVLQIASDGALKLNQDVIDRQTCPHPLPEIYEPRAEKYLYVIAEPNLPDQDFV